MVANGRHQEYTSSGIYVIRNIRHQEYTTWADSVLSVPNTVADSLWKVILSPKPQNM